MHAELRLNLLAVAAIDSLAQLPHPVASLVPGAVAITPQAPFMVIAPGAGSPIRVWALERLAAVSRTLIERDNLDAVLIGAAADTAACEFIASRLPAGRVYNLAGRTPLSDLPALIKKTRLFVGYDSGMSHLAACLGVPTVTVMGSIGTPAVWRVNGERALALATEIGCAGCYLNTAEECPYNVRCLDVISTEHVLAACATVLALPQDS